MQYAPIHPFVGAQPFADIWVPSLDQTNQPGMVCDAIDPYFGFGRFIYLQSSAAIALPGRVCRMKDQTFLVEDMPSTANLGQAVFVNRAVFSAANMWGWFQFEGITPVQTTNSVATAAAIGIGAAGTVGTNSAGKQLLGAVVLQAPAFAITKTNGVIGSGSKSLFLPNISGLFVGQVVSGSVAGIAGGATIASIDPNGNLVTLSANCTATVTIPTVTFTYTGFELMYLQSPHTQGAIT